MSRPNSEPVYGADTFGSPSAFQRDRGRTFPAEEIPTLDLPYPLGYGAWFAVRDERLRQVQLGYDAEHDDAHSIPELVDEVRRHLNRIYLDDGLVGHTTSPAGARHHFVRATAAALVAIESIDRHNQREWANVKEDLAEDCGAESAPEREWEVRLRTESGRTVVRGPAPRRDPEDYETYLIGEARFNARDVVAILPLPEAKYVSPLEQVTRRAVERNLAHVRQGREL